MKSIINNENQIKKLNEAQRMSASYVGHSHVNLNYKPKGFFNLNLDEKNPFMECWSIMYHPKSDGLLSRPSGLLLTSTLESNPTLFWTKAIVNGSNYRPLHKATSSRAEIGTEVINRTGKLTGDINALGTVTMFRCMIPNVLVVLIDGCLYALLLNDTFNTQTKNVVREAQKFMEKHKEDENYIVLGQVDSTKSTLVTHFDYAIVYKYNGVSYVNGISHDVEQDSYSNYLVTLKDGKLTDKLIKFIEK